jgi:type II secretory pathway pseudopilin PulG
VELLIVIALIAILSVAVLATINPIEQSNKARDAKFKNDAAEVLSAYERYYTSAASYPWMNTALTNPIDSIDTDVVFRSDDPHFGVVANGAAPGLLISSSELKSSFMSKESYVTGVTEEDAMYVVHNGTTNDNYVCFHPKAAVNRLASGTTTKLKCLNNYDATAHTGDLIDYVGTDGNCDVPTTWSSAIADNMANLLCVPEGNIQ